MITCWCVACFARKKTDQLLVCRVLSDKDCQKKGVISCWCVSCFVRKDCDQLLVLASDLYNILEDNNCLGKHFRQRSIVLKVIFRLLDAEDTKLLLKVARLILAVSVAHLLVTGVLIVLHDSVKTWVCTFCHNWCTYCTLWQYKDMGLHVWSWLVYLLCFMTV